MTWPRLTIEEMQQLALERGGWFLSPEYINSYTKHWYQCGDCGKIWETLPNSVKQGCWCRLCSIRKFAESRKLSIREIQQIALDRGGWFLSPEYYGGNIKHWYQCGDCEYIWDTRPHNVKRRKWCPECAKKKYGEKQRGTIEEMQQLALERGGWFLSPEYINSITKHWWQCGEGHVWDAIPGSVKYRCWCPECGTKRMADVYRGNIKEMQKLALENGGWFLSQEYTNCMVKHWWQCGEGHIWPATPDNIKRGKWCPECLVGVSEQICRIYFELIFDNYFPTKRPNWLINHKTGRRLELDGYCEKLGLAFEYNGRQHYESMGLYGEVDLKVRKDKDDLKNQLCKKQGLVLITVSYTVKFREMQNHIVEEAIKQGMSFKEMAL